MLFGLMSKYYTRTNTTLNYLYTPADGEGSLLDELLPNSVHR